MSGLVSRSSSLDCISTGIKTCFLLRACPVLLFVVDVVVVVDVLVVETTDVGVAVDLRAITTGVGDEAMDRPLPPD